MYKNQIEKYSQLFDGLKMGYIQKIQAYESKFKTNEAEMAKLQNELESLSKQGPGKSGNANSFTPSASLKQKLDQLE